MNEGRVVVYLLYSAICVTLGCTSLMRLGAMLAMSTRMPTSWPLVGCGQWQPWQTPGGQGMWSGPESHAHALGCCLRLYMSCTQGSLLSRGSTLHDCLPRFWRPLPLCVPPSNQDAKSCAFTNPGRCTPCCGFSTSRPHLGKQTLDKLP